MLPWQAQHAPTPPRPSTEPESEDDSLEAPPPPPANYFEACRSLFPSSNRRDALRAWDKTAGIGAGTRPGSKGSGWDMDSARVQAALGAFVDLCSAGELITIDSTPSTGGGSSTKRARSPSPAARPRLSSSVELFRRSSSPLEVLVSPQPKRARLPFPQQKAFGAGGGGVGSKGKAKERREELVLSDSDDGVQITASTKERNTSKSKGRAAPSSPYVQAPANDVLDLVDSSDESFTVAGPSRQRDQQLRHRSPSPLRPYAPHAPTSPLTQVLTIVPDVLPSHATALLQSAECAGNVEAVVDALLSAKEYPKIMQAEEEKKEPEKDWMDLAKRKRDDEPPSVLYKRTALDFLYASFPLLPTTLIKPIYLTHSSSFLAPAYFTLSTALSKGEYDDKKLKKGRKAPKKVMRLVSKTRIGKGGEMVSYESEEEERAPEELEREMKWVKAKVDKDSREARQAQVEADAAAKLEARVETLNEHARKKGEAVECGCCFDEVAAVNTAACDNGHLFCKTCCSANASDRLGKRLPTLPCMAPDCTAVFSPALWRDYLPLKTIEGLERLVQDMEVNKAFEGIEGFESCPFCPYVCLMENPNERLFRCEREDCRKTSCRKCRKEGHVPYTCEEADKDRRAEGVHAVAEAMSASLIRNCPKCKVPTAKIDGCNHMICTQCQAHWCYVCRVLIKGYDHFNDRGGAGTCPTFDDTNARNHREIEEARLAAEANLDDLTRKDAVKLADKAPPPNPRYPVHPAAPALNRLPVPGVQINYHLPPPPLPGAHGHAQDDWYARYQQLMQQARDQLAAIQQQGYGGVGAAAGGGGGYDGGFGAYAALQHRAPVAPLVPVVAPPAPPPETPAQRRARLAEAARRRVQAFGL